MSTQSIFSKDLDNLLPKLDKYYIKLGNWYTNHKRFDIGNKPDLSQVKILNKLKSIACDYSCNKELAEDAKKLLNSILITK